MKLIRSKEERKTAKDTIVRALAKEKKKGKEDKKYYVGINQFLQICL